MTSIGKLFNQTKNINKENIMYSLERKVERVFDAPCPLKRIQEFNELFNEQAHVRIFDFSNMKKVFFREQERIKWILFRDII